MNFLKKVSLASSVGSMGIAPTPSTGGRISAEPETQGSWGTRTGTEEDKNILSNIIAAELRRVANRGNLIFLLFCVFINSSFNLCPRLGWGTGRCYRWQVLWVLQDMDTGQPWSYNCPEGEFLLSWTFQFKFRLGTGWEAGNLILGTGQHQRILLMSLSGGN